MVDSEKLSLCCSDVGRYLLLGEEGGGERRVKGGGHISQEEADNKRFTAREGVGGEKEGTEGCQ